ncbi:hypothetical protein BDZ89DRAFT_1037283 [Hymenopellis radicata]|nr:hypothetical protein BDZ89DRAFT_1037283 [Hymenopellis radicata]
MVVASRCIYRFDPPQQTNEDRAWGTASAGYRVKCGGEASDDLGNGGSGKTVIDLEKQNKLLKMRLVESSAQKEMATDPLKKRKFQARASQVQKQVEDSGEDSDWLEILTVGREQLRCAIGNVARLQSEFAEANNYSTTMCRELAQL